MYSAPNARPQGFPLNTLAAQPSCGCAQGPVAAPLSRALTPFAPTPAWSSNLFGAQPGANGTGTGQLTPNDGALSTLASGVAVAGTALGAYHGYKRTESLGWALGWALLGGMFPFITIPVALAQGFGRREPAFRSGRR